MAYKLDGVRVYYNGQLLRQYRFHYSQGEYDGHPYCLLTQIEQLDADGGKTLPDMTFSYETHDILRREHKSDGHNSDKTRRRHFLRQADNGYGGWVRYTYRSWMPADTNKTFMQRWLVDTRQFGDATSGYALPLQFLPGPGRGDRLPSPWQGEGLGMGVVTRAVRQPWKTAATAPGSTRKGYISQPGEAMARRPASPTACAPSAPADGSTLRLKRGTRWHLVLQPTAG